MTARLHERARQIRTRAAIRAWEYRQRNHAHGVWFRLRRVLADARAAYAIDANDARRLIEEGARPERVGSELEPSKMILFVPAARLATVASRREVPLHLGSELLEARHLALMPWS